MLIETFHSGRRGQRRYCSLHRPATRLARSLGVVLCAPLGHEYFRTYRSCVKLADRLAQLGFPVLRFDHAGCGDSEGEPGNAELDDWLRGVEESTAELLAREPVSGIALGGFRFGATLAMLAAPRIESVHALILWDAIDDGARHVGELRRLHDGMLHDLERFLRARRSLSRDDDELIGSRFGARFLHQVCSLRATTIPAADVDDIIQLSSAGHAPGRTLRTRARVHAFETGVDHGWTDRRRIEEAIVDPRGIAYIVNSMNAVAA